MKFVVALCMMAVAAMAAPEAPIRYIPVLERTEKHDEVGQFALRYLSADGTSVAEQGILKPTLDGKDHVLHKIGEFTFTAPDGQVFRTTYVADHLGFRAVGDHLPKSVVA
ncbi:endocuticle structural glycoprotein SgAbd-2-like [Arctopsyche grandis]|uniref:endocuticle structural glycoprotein SgAbd-2-like n=1 Tax=Arctopsyche grandis TaxID=121162 RepID=UPI00406D8B96